MERDYNGEKNVEFECLAVKIFLGGAKVTYQSHPEQLQKLAKDLYLIFEKNQALPSLQKDLQKL